MTALGDRDRERYARQVMLFGEEGQERLKDSVVFIAGAGGLGSPAALYLAAAGVGEIRIADHDVVDRSNLNRQILHGEGDIGRRKVDSAAESLRALNPDVTVAGYAVTIDETNAASLADGADLIIDATDDFPTRYLLNRVALQKGIPFIHGAIRGFDGQATTVLPGTTACLRCIFPEMPPAEVCPVVGTAPGIIGVIQANEAIRCLLGMDPLFSGRLLLWGGDGGRMETVACERDPACPDCGGLIG